MPALYITSDRPGAGKTAVAGALAAHFSSQGRRVGYLKPFSPTPQHDEDVGFILRAALRREDDHPHLASLLMPEELEDGQSIPSDTAGQLRTSKDSLSSTSDLVLVEGPSLQTPQGDAATLSLELADLLDAKVMLVLGYTPELNVESVIGVCEPFEQRLVGVLVNRVTRYRGRDVRTVLGPALESRGVKFLGAMPEDRVMASVTVGELARHLEARWVLGEEKAQDLVENLLIGGNIMDSGSTYFGRMENQAVIVRGDRPDIQLAALSAPTTCLVLTGGHEPIQYVHHQAEQMEVPVLLVQGDTLSTADALDTVLDGSVFHHPGKLERFRDLMVEHVDLDAIQGAYQTL